MLSIHLTSYFFQLKYVIFFVICFKCSTVKSNDVNNNFVDFEQIKYEVFSTNFVNATKQEKSNFQKLENHQKCLNELNEIHNGLATFDEWAVKSMSIFFS